MSPRPWRPFAGRGGRFLPPRREWLGDDSGSDRSAATREARPSTEHFRSLMQRERERVV